MADEDSIRAYDIRKGDLAFERPSQHFEPAKPGDLYDLISKLRTNLMMGNAPNIAGMPMAPGPPSPIAPGTGNFDILKNILQQAILPVSPPR